MPGENLLDWSTTAASNATADSSIGWAEGMARAAVNDSARSMMAALAKSRDLSVTCAKTSGGTANAQTITSGVSFTSYPTGLRIRFKAGFTNTGALDLNVDGIGNKDVFTFEGDELAPGDVTANDYPDVLYNGTQFILLNPRPAKKLLDVKTASASATLDFTTGIDSSYSVYEFQGIDLVTATDLVDLWVRVSEDAGSTWKSGVSDYKWASFVTTDASTDASTGDNADSEIALVTGNMSNNSARGASFTLKCYNPAGTSNIKQFIFDGCLFNGTNFQRWISAGTYAAVAAITGVRFLASSGNLTSGSIRLYGIR